MPLLATLRDGLSHRLGDTPERSAFRHVPGRGYRCGRCAEPLSPAWDGACRHCGARYADVAPVVARLATDHP